MERCEVGAVPPYKELGDKEYTECTYFLSLPAEAQRLQPLLLEGMWMLIVEKVKGFGRARQPPLLGWIAFEPLMVILISILREEVNSSPEPLGLRYMELG